MIPCHPTRPHPSCAGLRNGDGLSIAKEEPVLASHLVTTRRGYVHHGIYIGAGRVVHYAGLANGLRRGPVEETSLSDFARGHSLCVKSDSAPAFEGREVINRALSRVGENCYRFLTNNCEHFCEWCLHGEHRSYQVEALVARPARTLRAAVRSLRGCSLVRWLSVWRLSPLVRCSRSSHRST